MRVAVVGGGINGIMTAWELAKQGCDVDLFERDALMKATSSASTKMLHGGLRYLEQGHFGLVYEALQERKWWLAQAPSFTSKFELVLPICETGRPRWMLWVAVRLYDFLAKGSEFPKGRWLSKEQLQLHFPSMEMQGVKGAYTYWDAQMDDYQLGLWAAESAKKNGVKIHERQQVSKIGIDGSLYVNGLQHYDRVVNVAGPWAESLLKQSEISSAYQLNLVRGSHLIIKRKVTKGCILQVPNEKRIIFLLPHGDYALLGTTEEPQVIHDAIAVSNKEESYLLQCYNSFFRDHITPDDIERKFSGLRPVVAQKDVDYSRASRESAIERQGKLISVFGGKWTTSRALAKKVVKIALQ